MISRLHLPITRLDDEDITRVANILLYSPVSSLPTWNEAEERFSMRVERKMYETAKVARFLWVVPYYRYQRVSTEITVYPVKSFEELRYLEKVPRIEREILGTITFNHETKSLRFYLGFCRIILGIDENSILTITDTADSPKLVAGRDFGRPPISHDDFEAFMDLGL